jgi:hypothetical protein
MRGHRHITSVMARYRTITVVLEHTASEAELAALLAALRMLRGVAEVHAIESFPQPEPAHRRSRPPVPLYDGS